MKKICILKRTVSLTIALLVVLSALSSTVAYAASSTKAAKTSSSKSSSSSTQLLSTIQSKGSAEITRRLKTLNTLDSKISASTKISSSDQATLESEVNTEISGLTTLQTTLAACTTAACAESAAQSIFSEYRVYALICPQVNMVKTADDQQLVQGKLTQIATQLASRLTSSETTLQSDLTTLNSDVSAAASLSNNVETTVLGFTPADWDGNHSLLVQYYGDLKTAQSDDQAAYGLAKTIIQSLTSQKSGSSTSSAK